MNEATEAKLSCMCSFLGPTCTACQSTSEIEEQSYTWSHAQYAPQLDLDAVDNLTFGGVAPSPC